MKAVETIYFYAILSEFERMCYQLHQINTDRFVQYHFLTNCVTYDVTFLLVRYRIAISFDQAHQSSIL